MQLIIENQRYSDPEFINAGKTADIHRLDHCCLAKVYKPEFREEERRLKVLVLCNQYRGNVGRFGQNYAFPISPAYEGVFQPEALAGFSMRDLGNIPEIGKIGFDIVNGTFQGSNGVRLDETRAIELVYEMFAAVDRLHQARIILGDLNDRNFLSDGKNIGVVDIDASQIGSFGCQETTPLFYDPQLKRRGINSRGTWTFDTGTDNFALSVIAFQFLIGVLPYDIHLVPVGDEIANKDRGISSIKCFALGHDCVRSMGHAYLDCPENKAVEKRLVWLQKKDRTLFDHFVNVFVKDARGSLLDALDISNQRHPGHHFFEKSGIDVVLRIFEKLKIEAERLAAVKSAPKPTPVVFRSARHSTSLPRTLQRRTDPPQLSAFLAQLNLTTNP